MMSRYFSSDTEIMAGRYWAQTGETNKAWRLYLEWYLFKRAHHCHFKVSIERAEDDGYQLAMGIPYLFNFYLSIFMPFLPLMKGYEDVTVFGFTLHEEFIWLDFWRDPMGGSRKGRICLDWKKLLLGKLDYKSEVLKEAQAVIALPEGEYPCKVVFQRNIWTRPRWKTFTRHSALVTPETPIPIPGKGEDIWNMDDDVIIAKSVHVDPHSTAQHAALIVRTSIVERRIRYGGSNWQPEVANG